MHFHVELHHLAQFEGAHAAADVHAEGVAYKMKGVMILEKTGVILEQRTLFGVLNISFQLHGAILARIVKQFIQHLEMQQVESFGKRTRDKYPKASFEDLNDDRQRIGDEHGTKRGAADNDQFRRLEQHLEVAMLHEIAARDGAKDNDNPNDCKHA